MRNQPDVRDGQRGMTIVELTIATALLVSIVGLTYGTVVAVHSINRQGEAALRQEGVHRDVLMKLHDELTHSSSQRDPITNQPRFTINTDPDGKQSITFQRMIGARMVGGELQATWSSDITVTLDDTSRVVRTQDGVATVLASGVRQLAFEQTPAGKFKVSCTTSWRDPRTGTTKDVTRQIWVTPGN